MNRFSRVKLASAVAVALAAGLGAPLQVSANPAFSAYTGDWRNHDQVGQVLLFPYYTVRDDSNGNPYQTSFTVINTGPDVVAVKFRLRDHVNSEDVLDFQWIMSPYDEVVAYMDTDPTTGRPRVNFPTDETTCRVPWAGGTSSFVAPAGGPDLDDALTGHLEVIPMWQLDPTSYYGKKAVHGSGQDCDTLSDLILNNSGTAIAAEIAAATANGGANGASVDSVDPVLRGSYAITNKGSGFAAGETAIAVSGWQPNGQPMVFGQNATQTVGISSRLSGTDTKEWDHPHLGDSNRTQGLDKGASAPNSLLNAWSTNPTNGVGSDWVATYFTKYLYRDANGFYGGGAPYSWPQLTGGITLATWRTQVPATTYDPTTVQGTVGGTPLSDPALASPWVTPLSGSLSTTNGGTCILTGDIPQATTELFDREEGTTVVSGVSPGSSSTEPLCNESNVISFEGSTARKPVLLSADDGAVVFDVSALSQPYGWANIEVNPAQLAYPSDGPDNASVMINGFAYNLRDLGQAASYAVIVPHGLFFKQTP